MPAVKNRYLANGHNYQSERLPLYLPGNGGLLAAAAMMAAGWEGCPDRPAPGFPDDGGWVVRWEGLRRMPYEISLFGSTDRGSLRHPPCPPTSATLT